MFNKGKMGFLLIFALLLLMIIPSCFAQDNATNSTGIGENSEVIAGIAIEDVLTAGNDYYFDADATDDGNGSKESPYKYLTSDRIKANCNIYLANGEYELDARKNIEQVNIYGSDVDRTIVRYGGVGFIVSNSLTVQNVTFMDLSIENRAKFQATNTVFSYGYGSSSDSYGNNYGGAISTKSGYSTATVSVDNCTFTNNFAIYGGAIYMGSGSLEVINSIFLNNMAYNYGGAIACENTANVTVSKSRFYNSVSINDAGGAIYIKFSKLSSSSLEIVNSSATFGGAVTTLNSEVSIVNMSCINNTARYAGGAVYHMYGDFSLTGSRFTANHAGDGGALFIDNSTKMFIRSNQFLNNTASNCAGAIYSLLNKFTSPIKPFNTFTGNTAKYNDNEYEVNSLNLVIGDGNYTMVRVNDTRVDSIPSRYSLIDDNLVTPVKDQETSGNCWAFAAISVLESCLLKATGIAYDLSEENMKNIAALFSDYGWKIETNEGGYEYMPWGYLTSWIGPVSEIDDITDDKSVLSAVLKSIFHIQNILFLDRDNFTDNDAIKQAVLKYGAVGTYMAFYNNYYDSSTNAYYCYSSMTANHAVTIVGWDDNYSKSNFRWGANIKGDGAWIVRNSWSSSWGDGGYFYVSYYDEVFARPGVENYAYTFILNDTIKYDKNYQYDIAGMTDYFVNSSDTVWYKNLFKATDNEYLAAVSTYFEKLTNWTVSIYVNGNLVLTQDGFSNPGYFTIDLDELIPLKAGDDFEVEFKISVDGEANFPISEIYSLNKMVYCEGSSFVSYDGVEWQDLHDLSWAYSSHTYSSQVACIKSFTVLNEIGTTICLNASRGNVTATVKNQYGNLVRSGEVIFDINNEIFTVKLSNGIAVLPYNFFKMQNTIYAMFNATGYLSSTDVATFNLEKSELDVNLNLTRTLNNVTINLIACGPINMGAVLVVNGDSYDITFINGRAGLNLTDLSNGLYDVSVDVEFPDDWIYENKHMNFTFSIDIKNTQIIASDVIINDEDLFNYTITITDENGTRLSNKSIAFNLDGNNFTALTDSNGLAGILLNLTAGVYDLNISFAGDNDYLSSNASASINVRTRVVIDLAVERYQNNVNLTVNLSKSINDNVTVIINNKSSSIRLLNGTATLELTDLVNDDYLVNVTLNTDYYDFDEFSTVFTVDVKDTLILADNLTINDEDNINYTISLTDSDGNPLSNRSITYKLAGKYYELVTDSDGRAIAQIMLYPGNYDMDIRFEGDNEYFKSDLTTNIRVKTKIDFNVTITVFSNNVTVTADLSKNIAGFLMISVNGENMSSRIVNGVSKLRLYNLENGVYTVVIGLDESAYDFDEFSSTFEIDVRSTQILADDLTVNQDENVNYTVSIVDDDGIPLSNKYITFDLNGNTYHAYSDDEGHASIPISLNPGIYLVKISFSGDEKYTKSDNSTTILVKTVILVDLDVDKFANNATLKVNLSKEINDNLTFVINNESHVIGVIGGIASLNLYNLDNGIYNVDVLLDDLRYSFNRISANFTVNVTESQILSSDIVVVEGDESFFNVSLVDGQGNPISGRTLTICFNNSTFTRVSDDDGHVSVLVNLTGGAYDVDVGFAGDDNYFASNASNVIRVKTKVIIDLDVDKFADNATISVSLSKSIGDNVTVVINNESYVVGAPASIILYGLDNGNYSVSVLLNESKYSFNRASARFTVNVTESRILSSDIVVVEGDGSFFNVSLVDANGNPISNRTLTLKIGNSTFTRVSDDDGNVSVLVNLTGGAYDVDVGFAGDDNYFASNASNVIKVKSRVFIDLAVEKYANNVTLTASLSRDISDNLTFTINGKSHIMGVVNGTASIYLHDLENGNYDVNVLLNDEDYAYNNASTNFTVSVLESKFISSDLNAIEGKNTEFNVVLLDANDNPIVNRTVEIRVDNSLNYVTTDENGRAGISVNLTRGMHPVGIVFNGDDDYFATSCSNEITAKREVVFNVSVNTYQDSADIYINASNVVDCVSIDINAMNYQFNNFTGKTIHLKNLSNGIYNVHVYIKDDEFYEYAPVSSDFTISVKSYRIQAQDFTTYFMAGSDFKVILTDDDNNPVAGEEILFDLNDVKYPATTDESGVASVKVYLTNGDYPINVTVQGSRNHYESKASFTIHVKTTIQPSDILVKTYNSNYAVLFLDANGNPRASSNITFILNGVTYTKITDSKGYAYLTIVQKPGNYKLTAFNDWNGESITRTIKVKARIAQNKDMTIYAFSGKAYKVRVYDDNGNPVGAGEKVTIKIAGRTKTVKTNAKGYASYKISLKNKKYTITATYKGFKVSNRITVKPVLITSNKVFKKAKYYKFTAKLVNGNGKALKNKKITFKIKGKRYVAKTNKYGKATIKIKLKLKVGTHKIYSIYKKSKNVNKIKIKK